MKNTLKTTALLLTLLLATVSLASADNWDTGSDYNQHYNAETVRTLNGEILSIHRDMVLEPGMAPAVIAVLETEDGLLNVHVGPRWFTEHYRSKFELKEGDQVEVTGSVIDLAGSQTMLLQSGKKGDLEMVIRGYDGDPVWDPEVKGF